MTFSSHLLLVLALHGSAAQPAPVDATRAATCASAHPDRLAWRGLIAEEIEDSEDDRVERTLGALGSARVVQGTDTFVVHAYLWGGHGDDVATHSARGPPTR